jgi:hypothetical protein
VEPAQRRAALELPKPVEGSISFEVLRSPSGPKDTLVTEARRIGSVVRPMPHAHAHAQATAAFQRGASGTERASPFEVILSDALISPTIAGRTVPHIPRRNPHPQEPHRHCPSFSTHTFIALAHLPPAGQTSPESSTLRSLAACIGMMRISRGGCKTRNIDRLRFWRFRKILEIL